MLPSEEIVNVVRDCLAGTREISLVVDPVLAATSGSKLAGDCAFEAMKSQLFLEPLWSLLIWMKQRL